MARRTWPAWWGSLGAAISPSGVKNCNSQQGDLRWYAQGGHSCWRKPAANFLSGAGVPSEWELRASIRELTFPAVIFFFYYLYAFCRKAWEKLVEDWTECPNFFPNPGTGQVRRASRESILGNLSAFMRKIRLHMSFGWLSIRCGCQPLISRLRGRCGVRKVLIFPLTSDLPRLQSSALPIPCRERIKSLSPNCLTLVVGEKTHGEEFSNSRKMRGPLRGPIKIPLNFLVVPFQCL